MEDKNKDTERRGGGEGRGTLARPLLCPALVLLPKFSPHSLTT